MTTALVFPRKPALTTWGVYDTIDLARYLQEATGGGMRNDQIARHLGVSIDRVVYFLSRVDQLRRCRNSEGAGGRSERER